MKMNEDFLSTIQPKKRAASSKIWRKLGFPRRADLEAAIRSITNNVPLNTPLSKTDEEFLISILQHHADWNEKCGVGIAHLEMRINVNGTGSTRGIWITRTDGSEIDISWVVALKKNGKTTSAEDLKAAAREAIQDQMHEAHDTLPCEFCDLCGEPMKRYDNLHADHVESFSEIFYDFFGGSEDSVKVDNAGTTTKIVDPEIAQAWRAHHAARAKLRLVHKACNLKRKKS
jgi:hypothetical protein